MVAMLCELEDTLSNETAGSLEPMRTSNSIDEDLVKNRGLLLQNFADALLKCGIV